MTQLFGIPLDTLTIILVAITICIIIGVALLAITNAIFFKIGIRNIPRRRSQMLLIVFALMLSTTLLSSVLATGDVITAAVQTVAVSNLGNVDETIQSSSSPGFFDDRIYYQLRNRVRNDPNIAAIGAALIEQGCAGCRCDLLARYAPKSQPLASYLVVNKVLVQFRMIPAKYSTILPIFKLTRFISIIHWQCL